MSGVELETIPGPDNGGEAAEEKKHDESEEKEVRIICGCIPHTISGSCGPVNYYINPIVMFAAIIIIWVFVIWVAVDTDNATIAIGDTQEFAVKYFGWFYISSLILFGSFACYLAFSRFGDIKLGPEDEPPKYSLMTWFSMLFSAGIGIGLYFFGVAEPVYHFDAMQKGGSRWYFMTDNQHAMESLNISWFHWGFTASATYCVAALPLAYHHHVKNEPLRESVCFMALIGEKYAEGLIGCLIDLTSVISTMFGVATSLGLGVLQITAGLNFVFDVETGLATQMIIIWVITGFATVSVLAGLDVGIRRISEVNFGFSFIILFFMFFALDPIFLVNLFIQGIGYHLNWILELTFNTQAFEQVGFHDVDEASDQSGWMASWTIFYWAWWIAWAPFVGIFIAQISRGRTIREFIVGNMMVPTLFTCIWLTVFGGIGLYNELGSVQNNISCSDDEEEWYSEFDGNKIVKLSCFPNAQQMLFATYNTLPLPTTISILSMVGILTYFVTSSDSASHVIDILTAGGNVEPPKLQRIFWAFSEGAVASVLLAAADGGTESLAALQTVSLVAAVPFCVVLIFEVMATYKTLLIHFGDLKPEEQVYWKVDLFAAGNEFPMVIFALMCPPYFQMKTRLKIIENNSNQSNNDSNFENSNGSKYFWVCAYWILWFLIILFLILELAVSGFFQLGLAFYLFYMVLCIGNRGIIKNYYGIDSSHIIFDIFSWVFCCCCAAVQEDLQSDQGKADLSMQLKVNEQEKASLVESKGDDDDKPNDDDNKATDYNKTDDAPKEDGDGDADKTQDATQDKEEEQHVD